MLTTILLTTALFAGPQLCHAGGWGTVSAAVVAQATRPVKYEWVEVKDNADQVALLADGRWIGSYNLAEGYYRPYDRATESWGARCEPPVAPPAKPGARASKVETQVPNYGLGDPSQFSTEEQVTICGRPVTKAEALTAASGKSSSMPDDAKKPWLVFVGPKEIGDRLDRDLKSNKDLAPWRDFFRFQSYRPDDPMTRDRDGKLIYPPGLYLVGTDQTPAYRFDTYAGPAVFAGDLRKLPDNWNPDMIPDGSSIGVSLWLNKLRDLPTWVWVGGGGVLLILLVTRRRS